MSEVQTMSFTLTFDAFGKLVVTLADGTQHVGVWWCVRFRLQPLTQSISILSAEGKELAWVDDPAVLPPTNKLPLRKRCKAASSCLKYCVWMA